MLALADYGKAAARRELAMDRGVKIAIFVACIAALSLGLIWDQVLSSTRNVIVKDKPATDLLGPEIIPGLVGPQNVGRAEITQAAETPAALKPAEMPLTQSTDTPPGPTTPSPQDGWIEYTPKSGEGWWWIANRVFKGRGLTSNDIAKANPGVTDPVEGRPIKIPPTKK